jgi:hypothetical protein
LCAFASTTTPLVKPITTSNEINTWKAICQRTCKGLGFREWGSSRWKWTQLINFFHHECTDMDGCDWMPF